MKAIYTLLIAAFLTSASYGQNIIDDHYLDLKNDENNTYVFVSGRLFELAAQVIPEDEEIEELGNLKDFVSKVNDFQLVSAPELENPTSEYNKGVQLLRGDYDELISVRESDNKFTLFVDEEGGTIYELVGIGMGDGDFVVFTLSGEIDLDKIGELISHIKDERMTKVVTREDINIDEMKIYPNPSNKGSVLNIDIPSGMIGGTGNVFDMSGARVSTFRITDNVQQLETTGMAAGNYIVELQNDQTSMKKKVLIVK